MVSYALKQGVWVVRYTSKMLLAAIDEQHRGTYDFIYLPIDFKVRCAAVAWSGAGRGMVVCCMGWGWAKWVWSGEVWGVRRDGWEGVCFGVSREGGRGGWEWADG